MLNLCWLLSAFAGLAQTGPVTVNSTATPAAGSRKAMIHRPFDVTHYGFFIEVNDLNDTIAGVADISLLITEPAQKLGFDLASVNKGKGMMVSGVTLQNQPLTFNFSNDELIVDLGGMHQAGEPLTIGITYKGVPSDGLIISRNKFKQRTFFADNWPNRAHNWIPCVDDPADKASVEFMVVAPSHYRAISNGVLVMEKAVDSARTFSHWQETIELPTKVMVIGLADFAVDTPGVVGRIPVTTWVFKPNQAQGFSDYSITPPILQWMIGYIAPFPYAKLAHVQSKTIFGGMENAGAIFYYENSVNGMKTMESTFAHEIAHQYFGDMATEKSFSHVWLSEGFATYLTHLYMESKYGSDSLAREMELDRGKVIEFSKGYHRPVTDTSAALMDLLNANSYEKGSWCLHMLRRQVGDSAFHRIIKRYYQLYAGKNADTDDFRRVAEEVTHRDLKQFFFQWLMVAGQPDLDLTWNYNASARKFNLHVLQKQAYPFVFPLEIQVTDARGKKQLLTFKITGIEQDFAVPLSLVPVSVKPDPKVSLLYSGAVSHAK